MSPFGRQRFSSVPSIALRNHRRMSCGHNRQACSPLNLTIRLHSIPLATLPPPYRPIACLTAQHPLNPPEQARLPHRNPTYSARQPGSESAGRRRCSSRAAWTFGGKLPLDDRSWCLSSVSLNSVYDMYIQSEGGSTCLARRSHVSGLRSGGGFNSFLDDIECVLGAFIAGLEHHSDHFCDAEARSVDEYSCESSCESTKAGTAAGCTIRTRGT
ncbi:uncharacterized protein C8Q71DRAFT_301706 [Rhodofomes roseus]|uniref:Uncharacterized protein n=1 Tax=Rhodofomes roseus TaxID=34475 RepID=A0ABQ8K3Y3_9APHY|nr:uncharacterized protein C8Q71DRAFT_301706 [Rhodofomes roseus]KAH9831393.1 hypothetical protein C8Q71DRAFT_301706 [Rhodofomes roseus]